MDQIRRLLAALTVRQKIYIGAAVLAVIGGLVGFLRWQNERDFALLYSGLSQEDAAKVVAKLKELGTEYRLGSDSASIRVKSAKLAELRLQMAAAEIPKTGRIGFELFDRTNFGTTEFTENINFNRALEGELERTVMSIAEIEHARVHITAQKDSVFSENRRPAKASVLLRLRAEAKLAPQNVKAISNLVANAVDGLAPEMVSVLDVHGNLLSRPKSSEVSSDQGINDLLFEYKAKIERDLLAKINNTLEPALGADRFRAAVSVDCDLSSTDQSEESFDPNRSVMTSSQRSEDLAGASQTSGVPGTPSNLPRPTSRPGLTGQGVARRTENIAFQTSRTVRRTHLPQGNVKRLSVSVLVDYGIKVEGTGAKLKRTIEPPPPDQLKKTRDLVAGVVGLQSERGDQLFVEALPFENTKAIENPPVVAPPAAAPPAAKPAPMGNPIEFIRDAIRRKDKVILGAIGGGVGALVLAGLVILFLRKRRGKKKKVTVEVTEQSEIEAMPEMPVLPVGATPQEQRQIEQQFQAQLAEKQRKKALQEQEIITELTANTKLPSNSTKKTEVLVKHLADETKKNPEGITQLVRTWVGDGEH